MTPSLVLDETRPPPEQAVALEQDFACSFPKARQHLKRRPSGG
jgi:hypothetical protein